MQLGAEVEAHFEFSAKHEVVLGAALVAELGAELEVEQDFEEPDVVPDVEPDVEAASLPSSAS